MAAVKQKIFASSVLTITQTFFRILTCINRCQEEQPKNKHISSVENERQDFGDAAEIFRTALRVSLLKAKKL